MPPYGKSGMGWYGRWYSKAFVEFKSKTKKNWEDGGVPVKCPYELEHTMLDK